MPQVRRRSLIPILQALIRLTMKMVLQLLVSHRRLSRQWVLSSGEYVACVLVKLTRKLGWKVGHAENLYVSITAKSCVGTIPIHPGPIFTNIIADPDFTYKLRFLTLQSRLCGSSCIAAQANDFHHRFTSKPVTPEQHNIVHGLYWVASIQIKS